MPHNSRLTLLVQLRVTQLSLQSKKSVSFNFLINGKEEKEIRRTTFVSRSQAWVRSLIQQNLRHLCLAVSTCVLKHKSESHTSKGTNKTKLEKKKNSLPNSKTQKNCENFEVQQSTITTKMPRFNDSRGEEKIRAYQQYSAMHRYKEATWEPPNVRSSQPSAKLFDPLGS